MGQVHKRFTDKQVSVEKNVWNSLKRPAIWCIFSKITDG
ncbi:MAG: hypothetical protein A4E59_02637 [Syntrophorhabdus sp. PtaB.Bin027]|jgi:hypothetical protein|nr:MAG: hypothetical protein A4E59_02637 [Syntrophorhabdus sp. PtaB.Bin027]OQB75923.1 MAG: hypothetical protein BWX92_02290 [Deltaproteobacteria bacterium ADurb.Bin135]